MINWTKISKVTARGVIIQKLVLYHISVTANLNFQESFESNYQFFLLKAFMEVTCGCLWQRALSQGFAEHLSANVLVIWASIYFLEFEVQVLVVKPDRICKFWVCKVQDDFYGMLRVLFFSLTPDMPYLMLVIDHHCLLRQWHLNFPVCNLSSLRLCYSFCVSLKHCCPTTWSKTFDGVYLGGSLPNTYTADDWTERWVAWHFLGLYLTSPWPCQMHCLNVQSCIL